MCQICQGPIGPKEGYVQVFNLDEALGPIGSYPVLASKDEPRGAPPDPTSPRHRGVSGTDIADLAKLGRDDPDRIGFAVLHRRCDPIPDKAPYWLATDRAPSLEHWVAWVIHLRGQPWMGRADLDRLLLFWWSHKGAQPPEV
jgi:hypothetical protein